MDQQSMISNFLEIAVGQTPDTAKSFLQATSWKLEDAIQLFYAGNEIGSATLSSDFHPFANERPQINQGLGNDLGHPWLDNENEVRAPIPVKREVLYDGAVLYGAPGMGNPSHEARSVVPFRNFDEEFKRTRIWESDKNDSSTSDSSRDNLASLYRPPFALIFQGPFEKAKDAANSQNKWLLVNLQSTREFSSHMLNRDTWANEAVAQTIISNFIFWQVYDDTEEGCKVSTYYKLDASPIVLVIDPITGQKMRSWHGMIPPEKLLQDLLPFMDGNPREYHATLSHKQPRERAQAPPQKVQVSANGSNEEMLLPSAASMEGMSGTNGVGSKDSDKFNVGEETRKKRKLIYPPLPEEPKADRNLLCRVGLRLPDGRRFQRNFLRTDPLQLLWSFCNSQLEEADGRSFRLTRAVPGASEVLEYENTLSFYEAGISNSMISVSWE